MKTDAQIIDWLKGGWRDGPHVGTNEAGVGIDTDGVWGFQCKDFANAYADWMGHPLRSEVWPANALTAWTQAQDPFWQKIEAGHPAEVGDIAVFKPAPSNGNGGHISVVLKAGIMFVSIDQNWKNPSETTGSPPTQVIHNQTGLYGYLRPRKEGDMQREFINYCFRGMLMREPTEEEVTDWQKSDRTPLLLARFLYSDKRHQELEYKALHYDEDKAKAAAAAGGDAAKVLADLKSALEPVLK